MNKAEQKLDFAGWFSQLKQLVGNLDKIYQPYFDLRETNQDCWRESFESGMTPEDCLRENLEALTN